MKKQTIAIHTPYVRPDAYGSLAVPVYSNVSFEFEDAQQMADVFCNRVKAPDYARIANPTVTEDLRLANDPTIRYAILSLHEGVHLNSFCIRNGVVTDKEVHR